MTSKTELVKATFEIPDKYLVRRRFDIRNRLEIVQQFTRARMFERVLDIGCGDGSISLPLLSRCSRLTLLDLSKKMLELARVRIPTERLKDVDLINGDFIGAELEPHSFDLILCIGVLAHVDSPAAVIAKVAQLAKPGACVVLEFTDSFHFWGMPVFLYQELLNFVKPQPYGLNRLKRRQVAGWCFENSLSESALYLYGMPPLGSSMFVSQEGMYRLTRYLFGPPGKNRNCWMGNQFVYLLQKT